MHVDTWAVVFATLLGPILAIEAQRQISLVKDIRNRKLAIFRALMSTRANVIAPEAVNAFNAIPIEFYGNNDVMGPWQIYFDHIETKNVEPHEWENKRWDLYCTLLLAISRHLHYNFDFLTIKNKVYAPQGHARVFNDQEAIRKAVIELLSGKTAMPMEVRSFPSDAESVQRINAVQIALYDWLTGKITPKVRVEN